MLMVDLIKRAEELEVVVAELAQEKEGVIARLRKFDNSALIDIVDVDKRFEKAKEDLGKVRNEISYLERYSYEYPIERYRKEVERVQRMSDYPDYQYAEGSIHRFEASQRESKFRQLDFLKTLQWINEEYKQVWDELEEKYKD